MSLKSKIESLMFVANKAVSPRELAEHLKTEVEEIEKAADILMQDYLDNKSGLMLIKHNNKYQMVSSPDNSKEVQSFLQSEMTGELSRPSLEALTIIAYRGPISKIDLDRIRGVNCALILRNLMIRGLIEEKYDQKKQENYYSVSLDFIRHLGISQVEELPDYEKLHQDDTLDKVIDSQANAEV